MQQHTRKPVVAVLKTGPATVLDDYGRLMRLAGYQSFVPADSDIALKINVSWQKFYPACSTTPWQLEGVIRTLLADGYAPDRLYGAHNRTVVVDAREGELANKHKQVLVDKYGLRNVHLAEEGEEWVTYEPKGKMRVLDKVYPGGIRIPRRLVGDSIIHLPTMKTHVFTTMTGAVKNAMGSLLDDRRHWVHGVIHEALVDLLQIQREISAGVFAVMDGTFAGDGAGPRCMVPRVTDYILASGDCVALDAVAAKMMGFEPMAIDFIRLAHESGLGVGRPEEIQVVGDDVSDVSLGFHAGAETLASRGQKLIYRGPLKRLERALLRSPIAPWSYLASRLYHDLLWYNLAGRRRVASALKTPWGRLFADY